MTSATSSTVLRRVGRDWVLPAALTVAGDDAEWSCLVPLTWRHRLSARAWPTRHVRVVRRHVFASYDPSGYRSLRFVCPV
jgi:hypothetical protein